MKVKQAWPSDLRTGHRVKLTREGQQILVDRYKMVQSTQITGVVTGPHPRLSHCIMVRLDGIKKSRGFDADYWRKQRGPAVGIGLVKNDSPEKLVLALARFKIGQSLYNLTKRAKVLAKDIRRDIWDNWTPAVDRLCRCGHPYSKHQDANCDHEVGGVCMRHTCAGVCNYVGHRSQGIKFHSCRCRVFRERPGNKVKP